MGTGGNWYTTHIKIQKLKILLNVVFIKKNNKPRFFLSSWKKPVPTGSTEHLS